MKPHITTLGVGRCEEFAVNDKPVAVNDAAGLIPYKAQLNADGSSIHFSQHMRCHQGIGIFS